MNIRDKLDTAVEMVASELDGATFIKNSCTVKELVSLDCSDLDDTAVGIIEDALAIKRHENKVRNNGVKNT